ncbi:MAG TPA: hypothetical protein VEI96_02450 [Thermodesulfovibrionales bacterium]|nr:hypothetical protein [Thermodesulfovibrionales bacterium]
MQAGLEEIALRYHEEDDSQKEEIGSGQEAYLNNTCDVRNHPILYSVLTESKGVKMSMTTGNLAVSFAVSVLISAALLTFPYSSAAEHPKEHPTGKQSSGAVQKPLTKKEMKEAIESYIEKESKKYGGFYEIYDDLQAKKLALKLKKVHDDRLAHVGNDVYFFCVDLTDRDGKVYDLDFFMKRGADGNLAVTEVTIHKQEGKERYTWYEENGIWKKSWLVQKSSIGQEKPPAGKPTVGDHPSPMPPR